MDEESEARGNSKERFLLQNLHHATLPVCRATPSRVWLFVTLWTLGRQAPLSMEFFRQEYWSRLPFSSSPTQGSNSAPLASPTLAGGFLVAGPPGNTASGKLLTYTICSTSRVLFSIAAFKSYPKIWWLKTTTILWNFMILWSVT